MFTLSFTYSKSKNYPKALEIADKLGGVMKDGVMSIYFHEYELLNAYNTLLPLFDIISKWKGVSATHKNKKVDPFRFVFQTWRTISECSQQRNDTWNERHCWLNNDQEGWGCKHLFSPAKHNYGDGSYKRSNRFWYNFGHFENNKYWIVNKKYLFELIMKQAEEKCCILCPFFDSSKLSNILSELPDHIEVDEMKYRILKDEFGKPINIRHIPPETVHTSKTDSLFSKVPFYCRN